MFYRALISPIFFIFVFVLSSRFTVAAEPINLSLEMAVARALRYNRNLKVNAYELDDSKLNLDAAKDVFATKISPLSSINYSSTSDEEQTVWRIGGQIKKKSETGIDLKLIPSVTKGGEDYSAGVGFSLAIPLLRGLGKDVTLDSVYTRQYSLGSSQRTMHRQRVNTVLDTVSAMYLLLNEQQLVSLYDDQLKALRGHLKNTKIKERAGIARSMDVYRVEIRIKEIEDSLNLTRERVAEAADRLKDIVVLPFSQSIQATAPLDYTFIDIDVDKAVQIALANRIEIHQAKADIWEARRREKVAKHNTLPDLKLEMGYTRRGSSSEFDDAFQFNEDFWSAGITSSTDLARSQEKSVWRRSRLAIERKTLSLESVKSSITREVRTVLNSLYKSEKRIALQREQIVQATGKQRLAHIKFQYNEADNFDLIEAQTQLERAKVTLLSDEMRYIVNGYRLRAAMGTLIAFSPSRN